MTQPTSEEKSELELWQELLDLLDEGDKPTKPNGHDDQMDLFE